MRRVFVEGPEDNFSRAQEMIEQIITNHLQSKSSKKDAHHN